MIKLLYLVPSLKKVGPTNQLYYMIQSLDRNIFDVSIITFSKKYNDDEYKKFMNLNINIIQLNMSSIYGILFGFIKIKNIVKKINPDIIHTHLFRADLIAAFFLSNYKRIATARGELTTGKHYIEELGFTIGIIYTKLHTIALRKIDQVVSISKAVSNDLNENNINNILINNGVDLDKYKQSSIKIKEQFRDKLNIKKDRKIFITVGSLIERKRPNILIKAFVNANISNTTLLVLGTGVMHDELINQYNHYENIVFLGFKKNVLDYLMLSDYFISVSSAEGLPNSVLEAASCGLPCILSNIQPHIEIIKIKDKDDFLVTLDNKNDLESKIKNIIDKDYNKLSNITRINIEKRFDSKLMSDNYQILYKTMFNK